MNVSKKNILIFFMGIIIIFSLTSCSNQKQTSVKEEKIVTVQKVTESNYPIGIDYLGYVKAKETKNYSFMLGGKIEGIYVEKGQKIKAGDMLAKLDTTSLKYSSSIGANNTEIAQNTLAKTKESYDTNIEIAETNIKTLEASIDAAKTGLDTLKSNLDALEVLHQQGAIADKEWEARKAEYKSKEAEYGSLLGSYENAKKNLENLRINREKDINAAAANVAISETSQSQAQKNISDATLSADSDGYVMEVTFKKGEIIGAGIPVIIAKSSQQIVTIGVSSEDYEKINKNSKVEINDTIDGAIDSIALYPDEQTRTYAVDIAFHSDDIAIGETVNVTVLQGEGEGYFVPIESIFNIDGVDYVYIVDENNKINRKQVVLDDVKGNMARVSNLGEGSLVVTEGIKTLKENDIVQIADPGKVGKS